MDLKDKIEIITMIIGTICTVISIYFGFAQINSTLKKQRFSHRLGLADDLVSKGILLSEEGSKAILYLVADANKQAGIYNSYSNSMKKHAELLEEIKNKIMAYGSTELVNLFFDSYNDIRGMLENGRKDFESFKKYFYTLPLIASYIKYDLTGEYVNPSLFYNSFMRELKRLEVADGMKNFHREMVCTNNEFVKKYKLSNKFIWKEDK